MSISKFLKKLLLPILLVVTGAANAQIPTTDVAAISTQVANQVEQIAKWAQQFQQMKAQIEQAKAQLESMTGSRGLGNILNNEQLKSLLPEDWQKIATDIQKTAGYMTERNKYPTVSGMPKTNAMYDLIASQNSVMNDLYGKSQSRLKQIQDLMAKIDTAADPAAKTDLTNRLISEQNSIQANQNLVAVLQSRQKAELDSAASAAAKEYGCKEFKRASC